MHGDSEWKRVCVCEDRLGILQRGHQVVATFHAIVQGDISLVYN